MVQESDRTAIRLQVFRLKSDTSFHVRILSMSYGGCMTHWKGSAQSGRSFYCSPRDCKLCCSDRNRTWKGYFAGEVYDTVKRWWVPFCVELTEAVELDLRHRFGRGQTWTFSRAAQVSKKKTPVKAVLLEERDPAAMPPAFDFLPVLRTLYHTTEIELDVASPVPDRIYVEPTAGDAPGARQKVETGPTDVRVCGPKPSIADAMRRRPAGGNGQHDPK